MSQNINLFNPAFRKKRQLLTLAVVLQFAGLAVAGLVSYQIYLQEQIRGLASEMQSAEGLLRSQRGFVERVKGKTAAAASNKQLDADIARYESELKLAREAMDALKGGAFGNRQGFAEYLRALSRQSMNGLWLTRFTIAGSGELEIHGRVLTAELVPAYIQRLSKEQIFTGRSFARLEMSRPRPAPAAGTNKDAGPARGPVRYLDFTLATTGGAKGARTP